MKQIIGIYCGNCWFTNWDEDTVKEGAGGSETWAVELASVFQRYGFHVIVFGQPIENHFAENGVEYVKAEDFVKRCEYQHFDYFISSRKTEELTPSLPDCTNIFIMGHDTEIELRYDTAVLKLDRVKKIMLLSDWQKRIYLANYEGLTEDRIIKTCNGVIQERYENIDEDKKENLMIWSSAHERGLKTFIDYIFPHIKEKVPDFRLKICGYDTRSSFSENVEGIEFIGRIGKDELAALQKKAKIWVYPNIGTNDNGELFHETFCITAVENALAKNAIVCFKAGGIVSTLNGYKHMFCEDCFNNLDFRYAHCDIKEMCGFLVEDAIKMLLDESYRRQAAAEAYDICTQYTWEKCAKDWLREWGLIYE